MKIASKKPLAIKSNVYVTNETYECFYAEPVSLGQIHKRGDYWYTADGHRHVSSRDALNYLISHTRVATNTDIKTGTIPEKLEKAPRPRQTVAPADQINQNHPMFQQFMDFLDFTARRKARTLEGATQSTTDRQ